LNIQEAKTEDEKIQIALNEEIKVNETFRLWILADSDNLSTVPGIN